MPDYGGHPIRLEQNRGPLFDANAADGSPCAFRPPLNPLIEPRQEHQQPSHAVPFGKMGVGDDALRHENIQKAANQRHTRTDGSANAMLPSRLGSSDLSPCAL